jgi:hypothetical protein
MKIAANTQQKQPVAAITAKKGFRGGVLVWAATLCHVLVVLKKMGPKWVSNNMGGIDGLVLAISKIAFTKSVQRSDRIF